MSFRECHPSKPQSSWRWTSWKNPETLVTSRQQKQGKKPFFVHPCDFKKKSLQDLGVSKNNGTPQIIHFNRVFHYKPSILGYPYFWKYQILQDFRLAVLILQFFQLFEFLFQLFDPGGGSTREDSEDSVDEKWESLPSRKGGSNTFWMKATSLISIISRIFLATEWFVLLQKHTPLLKTPKNFFPTCFRQKIWFIAALGASPID